MRRGIVAHRRAPKTLIALAFAGFAIAGGTVEGRVSDPTQASISHATVRLLPKDSGETKYRTTTDQFGKFKIEGVEPGQYTIRAGSAGFIEGVAAVFVTEGQIATAPNIELQVDCDIGGCFEVTAVNSAPAIPDVIVRVGAILRPGCGIDLDTGMSHCPSVDDADIVSEAREDGALYLAPVNGAKVTNCHGDAFPDSPIRIDGAGRRSRWCLTTRSGNQAKILVNQDIIEPGSNEIRLSVVTRK